MQYQLGSLDLDEDNPTGATARLAEALVMSRRVDDRHNMARALDGMGRVALQGNDTENAAILIAAAERLRATLKTHIPEEEKQRHEITLKKLHQQSDASLLDTAYARGQAMNTEQAVALALQHSRDNKISTPDS